MRLSSNGVIRYRAYILYGKSVDNILQRIVSFAEGCNKVIVDEDLEDYIKKLCRDNVQIVGIKSYSDVDKIVSKEGEGKALVFLVESPRDDVYAVALIPIDKFNKSVAKGG